MIKWIGETEFELDGINFTIDITAGPNRRQSTDRNFTIVKTKSYIQDYVALADGQFSHILELGLFQGGSLVFFDKMFKPDRMVGLDISPTKIAALENYLKTDAPHIKTYYKSSQDDVALLQSIVKDDLRGRLNLVVDDASHLYELTKASIATLFPLLEPGGTYIIEDWAWSHRLNGQTPQHPWYAKPALTNLLFEIVVELGSTEEIDDIYINNNLIKIRKARGSHSGPVFQNERLRGRGLILI
jgi:cephalosporin hydroxylase